MHIQVRIWYRALISSFFIYARSALYTCAHNRTCGSIQNTHVDVHVQCTYAYSAAHAHLWFYFVGKKVSSQLNVIIYTAIFFSQLYCLYFEFFVLYFFRQSNKRLFVNASSLYLGWVHFICFSNTFAKLKWKFLTKESKQRTFYWVFFLTIPFR